MLLFAVMVIALFLAFCAGYGTRAMLSRRRRAMSFSYQPYGLRAGEARTVFWGWPTGQRNLGH